MANYTTTITNEGTALLASVIANQGTLTFNEFRFSENDYTGQESTLTEGTFLGVFITASVAASVINSTTIKASAQFNNSTITGNHDLYSIGIIGTDGNTTALIAVCTTTDPDVIREPLTGTSTYAFNVNLTVSDTSQITVVGTTAAVIYDIDVVDNLTSTATNKPLSANQGRVLKDNIDDNFSGQSNENLVDNPFFTVNQRGATTITSGYGADRWKKTGGTSLTFSSSGVTFNAGQISQEFENQLPNGTYTASIKYSDGSIVSGTAIKNNDTDTINFIDVNGQLVLGYVPTVRAFYMYSSGTVTVRALKLEVGTVSTLANDVEPNYTAELLKCQRYFYRMTQSVVTAQMAWVMGFDGTNTYGFIKTPVPMASSLPTLSFTGTFNLSDVTNTYPVTSMSLTAYGGDTGTLFAQAIGGGITVNKMYVLMCGSSNAYIDLSANL